MTMAEIRKYRREHGLCTHCGKAKEEPNLLQCTECREATYRAKKKPNATTRSSAALSTYRRYAAWQWKEK